MSVPRVVTAEQIRLALMNFGVPSFGIRLLDATYRLPDLDYYVGGEFWDWYCAELSDQGLYQWGEDWDCDDFALDYVVTARKSHKVRQRKDREMVGQSVAIFFVTMIVAQPGITGSHAFVLLAQWDEAKQAIVFKAVEPQPNAAYRFYELTYSELVTAFVQ